MRQILQVLRQKDVLDQQRKYITETASKDEQLKRAFDEIGALNKKLADQETESEQKARINVTCSAGILQRLNEVLSEKKKTQSKVDSCQHQSRDTTTLRMRTSMSSGQW